MKKLLFILLFIPFITSATVIYPVPEDQGVFSRFFSKVAECTWHISCYRTKFGTTLTTINGSDTLSASRSVINNNFTALNEGKIEIGTTSVNSITTLSGLTSAASLATIGTITSGTWTGTGIGVAYGGTGTTSPTLNQVMLGNGSSGFKVIGFGSSGQFLTSNGNGTAPSWTTSALDPTLDYNWTGTSRFKNFHASSTLANPITLNGLTFYTQSTRSGTSTVLAENGSGGLTFVTPQSLGVGSMLGASTTDKSVNDSTVETTYGTGNLATLPANIMGTTGAFKVRAYISTYSDSGNNNSVTMNLKLGGTTVCSVALPAGSNLYGAGYVNFTMFSNASASAQSCLGDYFMGGSGSTPGVFEGSSSIDISSDQVVALTFQWDGNNPGDTESFTMSGAEVIFEGK